MIFLLKMNHGERVQELKHRVFLSKDTEQSLGFFERGFRIDSETIFDFLSSASLLIALLNDPAVTGIVLALIDIAGRLGENLTSMEQILCQSFPLAAS